MIASQSVRFLLGSVALPVAMATCGPRPDGTTNGAPSPVASQTPSGPPIAIVNATVWTGDGPRIRGGRVVIEGGKIVAAGAADAVAVPEGAQVIDAGGRDVTPGLVDVHSHNGVYPSPSIDSTEDGNEMTDPVTPQVDARHGIWPQDPNLMRALSAGNTTSLILPGSGNLIGGRGVVVHNVPARTAAELVITAAPGHLKIACGENPKRMYGKEKKSFPMTRMGNHAGYREAFEDARAHAKKRKDAEDDDARDWKKETLADAIDGKILVQNHCYRAEEMQSMIELADEMGFEIRAFHHALEAYKVRDVLAEKKIGVATWADWWGFKLEAWDGIPQNAALLHEAGVKVAIHSDSPIGAQRLNHEAAKALAYGRRAGIRLTEEDALTWITANAAWIVGLDATHGTLAAGKNADVVVWSANPFSIYSRADLVLVDGRVVWDRADGKRQPRSDFELGVAR